MTEHAAEASPFNPGPPPRQPSTWLNWLGIGFSVLIARLPWYLQRKLGRVLGRMLKHILGRRRKIAARNLELCFPELDNIARKQLLNETFASMGIGIFEFARAWWGDIEPMRKNLHVEGVEHLQAAQQSGRGVIVVSGHFTTLEIAGRLMCDYVPLAGMYRPHTTSAMEWAVKRGRLRYAKAMFTRDELRPALKYLKQGGLLWFAPDQDTLRGDSVFVPFFGIPAHSLTSTHQLARLSGAAVITFSHERRPDGGYTLRVSPPFEDFPSKDPTADTLRVMGAIEAMARKIPSQYLWVHRRFKRQPEGSPSLYE